MVIFVIGTIVLSCRSLIGPSIEVIFDTPRTFSTKGTVINVDFELNDTIYRNTSLQFSFANAWKLHPEKDGVMVFAHNQEYFVDVVLVDSEAQRYKISHQAAGQAGNDYSITLTGKIPDDVKIRSVEIYASAPMKCNKMVLYSYTPL